MNTNNSIQKIFKRVLAMLLLVILVSESAEYSEVVTYAITAMEENTKKTALSEVYTEIVLNNISQSSTSVTLDWEEEHAAFDGTFVLYRNDEKVETTEETCYTDEDVTAGKSYTYYVEAYNRDEELIGTSAQVIVKVLESKSITSNLTLDEDMEVGDLSISNSATLDLNGNTLTVRGSVTMENDSSIKMSKGYLKCFGDFNLKTYSYLYMSNANDYIWVNGNVNCGSRYANTKYLTSGTIEIVGNFTHTLSNYDFSGDDDFTVKLSGTKLQTVSFANTTSYFQVLELNNYSEAGVYFSGAIQAKKVVRNGCNVNCADIQGDYGWTLKEDEVINKELVLIAGNLNLNGHTLTIKGDFIQMGGEVKVNGGRLIVEGDYRMQTRIEKNDSYTYTGSSGFLCMDQEEDYVEVDGDFYTSALYSHDGYLTDGILELKGNFTQTKTCEYSNFAATKNHRVLLSGDCKQTITFANVRSTYSHFANLEITNESEEGVVFDSNKAMATGMVTDHGNATSGYLVPIASTTFANNRFSGNVYYTETVTTSGELTVDGDVVVGNSVYLGRDLTVGKDLTINGYFNVQGKTLKVSGNIVHKTRSFELNGGKVYCHGNYTEEYGYSNDNRLIMSNSEDYFCVDGNVEIGGAYNNSYLTAGILEIKGDFTQKTNRNAGNFVASGSHTTIFSGTSKQTILFDSASSYFHICEIKNESEEGIYAPGGINATTLKRNGCNIDFGNDGQYGWTLEEDEVIAEDLRLVSDELDLAGHTLTINGNLIQEGGTVHINGGKLVVKGDYRIQSKTEKDGTVSYGKSSGVLQMTNTEDYVKVEGDFMQGSTVSHSGKLTAGTLEIKGDFTQEKYAAGTNFAASENHKVLFSGDSKQTITFANVGSKYSHFANLEITNESKEGVVFDSNKAMATGVVNDHGNRTSGYLVPIASTTFENNTFHGNVGIESTLKLGENLTVGKDIMIDSYLYLEGNTLEVGGNISHTNGQFVLGGGKVYCHGNYTEEYGYSNDNRLNMSNSEDYFCVDGNVEIGGAYNNSYLTAGILEIKGDFTQKTNRNAGNFVASGSHTTIFSGTSKQTILFDSASSYFHICEIKNESEEGIYAPGGINATTLKRNGCNIDFGNDGKFGWTLDEDETIDGDLRLVSDELDLAGHTLTVTGNLIQEGGTVHINGGKLVVKGDYRIQSKTEKDGTVSYGKSSGVLQMTNTEDYVKVEGDYVQGSTVSHSGKLTAGTLEIKGDFTQEKYAAGTNFAASENHKVLFSGDSKQTITFANVGSKYSHFANLEITNESKEGVVFDSNKAMATGVVNDHGNRTSGYLVSVASTTFADHTFHGNVYYTESITTSGELTVDGDVGIGSTVRLGGNLTVGKDVTIASYLYLEGNVLEVEGNISHTKGILAFDGGKIYCHGNYTSAAEGRYAYNSLIMKNSSDYMCVDGDVLIQSGSTDKNLTAGTLEIKGDFTQITSYYANNFAASGSHTTIFSGTSKQTISFDSTSCYFHYVELRNTSTEGIYATKPIQASKVTNYGSKVNYGDDCIVGWTLTEDTVIEDDVYMIDGTMDLNGHQLTVNGNFIVGGGVLHIHGGSLNVEGDLRIQGENTSLDTISYTMGTGALVMDSEKDRVYVAGDFAFQSTLDHAENLTAGTMEVKGNFYQFAAINGNFAATAEHTLRLIGTGEQIVNFAASSASASRLANLEVANESAQKVKINSNVYVTEKVTDASGNISGSGAVCVSKLSQIANDTFSGSITLSDANTCEENVTVGGTLTAQNHFDVNGMTVKAKNINVTSGKFTVNGGSVQCSNDFTISGSSYLVMQNPLDYIVVGGNFSTTSNYSHSGYLTNGVLEIKGDFTQTAGNRYNFFATEEHKVILSGKSGTAGRTYIQEITMNNVGDSTFAALELTQNSSRYKFSSDVEELCTTLIWNETDHEAPSKVPAIYASSSTASTIKLIWDAATDNQGVAGYEVYRDSKKIATTGNTTYVDKHLKPDTVYTYTVYAFDESRNVSEISDEFSVKTLADEEAPSVPENLKIKSKTGSSVTIGWDFAEDNVEIAGYDVYREGEFLKHVGNVAEYKDATAVAGKSYEYQVAACDTAGNVSERSSSVIGYAEGPSILSMTPSDSSRIGGNRVTLEIYFKNVGNSTGNKVQFEYSDNAGETWNKINQSLLGQKKYSNTKLYASTSWDVSALEQKEYLLRAILYDADNNTDTIEATYYLDKDAPEVPTNVLLTSKDGMVTMCFARSASADVQYYTIYRKDSEGAVFKNIETIRTNEYLITYDDDDVECGGTYAYYVTATDAFGQESEGSEISWITVEEDKTAPVITKVTPTSGTKINHKSTITVSAYDAAGIAYVTMEYFQDGQCVTVKKKKADSNTATFTWDNRELADGTYSVCFTVEDNNGNINEEEYMRSYVVDNTGISKIKIKSASADSSYVALKWEDVEEDDFAYFQVEQLVDGTFKKVGTTTNVLGMYIKNLKADTEYTFRVVGYDTLGNRGEESEEITLVTETDTTTPVITDFHPASTKFKNQIPLAITVTDNIGAVRAVFEYSLDEETWHDLAVVEKTAATTNNFKYTWDVSEIREGKVYVRVRAYDAAGNENVYVNEKNEILTNCYQIDRTAAAAITDLKAEGCGGYVSLTWNKPKAEDVAYYKIYRADETSGIYDLLVKKCTTSNYYDISVEYGKTYSYKMTSVDIAGNESAYSNESVADVEEDTEAPTIYSVSPKSDLVVGQNTTFKVLVYDNVKVSQLTMEYRNPEENDTWTTVDTMTINETEALASFTWDTAALKSGIYDFNVYATDVNGNRSRTFTASYQLDADAPEAAALKAAKKNWEIDLTWSASEAKDFEHYELYRRAYNETEYSCVFTSETDCTYKDTSVTPEVEYRYYVLTYDRSGNYSKSGTVLATAGSEDTIAPVADASSDMSGIEGIEIAFDGTGSSDNVKVTKYVWKWGDGTNNSTGAQPTHTYTKAGTYTVILTVYDAAGNKASTKITVYVGEKETTGKVVVTVVDQGNHPVSNAQVYINNNDDVYNKTYITNSSGQVVVTGKTATYNIAAYKTNYLPAETYVDVKAGKTTVTKITLEAGDVVVGNLEVKKLELAEIVAAGIDLNDPSNYNSFTYTVTLTFAESPLPVIYKITTNGKGEAVKVEKNNNGKGESSESSGGVSFQSIPVEKEGTGEQVPMLAYLTDMGTVSWLKEIFSVELGVINAAEPKFTLENCSATLHLPDGLSLASLNTGIQSVTIEMKDIAGQQSDSAIWYIRGDKSGSYSLSADYHATLMPFETEVNTTFVTEKDISVNVGEGLDLTIMPESAAYVGETYYIQYKLTNNSDIYFYNLQTSLGTFIQPGAYSCVRVIDLDTGEEYLSEEKGANYVIPGVNTCQTVPVMYNGDSIEIGVFAPGDTLYGTTAMSPPSSTGEYDEGTYYFELVSSYAEIIEGQNTGVSVSVNPISSHASCSVVKHVTIDNSTIWADPVDTASGAYVEDYEALAVNGETTLSLDLNYSSMLTDTVGEMGKGWSHNFQTYLEETTGTVNLHWTPDSVSTFVRKDAVTHSVMYGNYLSDESIALSEDIPNEQEYLCISAGLDDAVLQRNEDLTYTLTLPSGVVYDFTKSGKLKKMTDENGRVLTLSYGKDEETGCQITTVTEKATGISIYLSYNSDEKLVKVEDANGRTAKFTYENDCLTAITNALGETTTYTYDEDGHVLTKKNAAGVTKVTNTYDKNGRVTVQTDANNKKTKFAYDDSAKDGSLTITITDRNGNEEKVTSDRKGNIIRKTNAEGETTVNMYDYLSNLLSVTDANNNTTYYKYDENGNQTQITDTEGKTTTMSYDSDNNLTSVIDGDGNTTKYTYDGNNLVTKIAYSSGKIVTYTYNGDKQIQTETIEGLGTKTYTYTDGYMTKVTDMNGNAATYTYDAYGNLASETNGYGTTTEYTYDKLNRLTKECILKENGDVYSQITYSYDVDGNQTKVTDANGNATAYSYDGNGELSAVTRTSDNTTLSYTKDAEGHVTKQTAADGTTRTYTYDKVGRVVEETNENGETTTYTYNAHGELVKTTDANGNATKYSYYNNGKLKQETYADGTYLYYSYDSCWNVARITNNEDHSTSYEYDSVGNLICERDPLGNEVTYTYDKYGRMVTKTDANGNKTSYTYDAEGNCLSETDALGQTVTYTYDKCNNLIRTTHANETGENVSIVYTYDRYGRNTSVKDECGNVASMKYDKAGNVISVTDAENNTTTYQYDSNNQLISQTDALGVTDTYEYDSMGYLTQLVEQADTDAEETSSYTYTKTGAISKAVDAENGVSKYTYDSVGNVKTVTDPMEGVTAYTYNKVNQRTEESNAIGATHAYEYNSEGLLETYTDAKEEVTAYTYDKAGRLAQLTDEAGTIRYSYDSNGNVVMVKDSNGVIQRTFDALNRVVSYTDSNDNTITYTYNRMGYLATMQYPDGGVVTYHYYDNGKLKSVTDADGNVTSYQYDGNGRVTEQDNSDGTKDTYAYDAAGQLIRQQVVKDETLLSYINYTYDKAGNVVSKESSQQDGSVASISSVTMTYDKANRIKTYNGETVTYDKEGNMTYGPSTEGTMTEYTYNCRNQLIQADKVKYEYDAEGNRTAQIDVETGTRTEYTNNTNGALTQVVMETATCNGKTSTTTYVYGNGLLSQNNSNGYLTFHYNNIGSTIVVTNEEGEAEEQYTYGPYGELLSGDTSKTAYLYNGMYGVSTDANGLYYMRARYYNVSIKRFLNQDVVDGSITNSQSLNKFSYVQGNPISLTDPFGLSPNISISGIGHAALDLLGIIPGFDFCDAINTAWYLSEGDYENAALSAVACIPLFGSVVGSGIKWGAKGVANAEKVADTVKLGSRIVGDGGAMLLSGGQAVESAKQVYSNITSGEGLTWKNAVDVLTLGISVAGMGMAGASIAKSGKSLSAMYKGETAISNVATSNATKGVSQASENAGQMKMDLQMFGGKSGSDTKRVGRWMSQEEYDKMVASGKVQMSGDNKVHVANPADINAFGKQAPKGSLYVEFDVPSNTISKGGTDGWGIINGPGSLLDRLNAKKGLPRITEMPNATNITIEGSK